MRTYRAIALCAGLVCGCTDVFLDITPRETPLGAGLEGHYGVWLTSCDPGDVYPAGCQYDPALVTDIESRDDVRLTDSGSDDFRALGRRSGAGSISVDASGFSAAFELEVVPIVYSMLTWFDGRYQIDAFADSPVPVDRIGPVFATSVVELRQHHYRAAREDLARMTFLDRGEVLIHGEARFKLDPGETGAGLVNLPPAERPFLKYPRTALKSGPMPGQARLGTHAGGELVVDIVDGTAVDSLTTYEAFTTGAATAPLDRYSWQLHGLAIVPLDRDGRPIAGCPEAGPVASDTAGLLEVSRLDVTETSFCELRFELAPEKEWQDTEIVVQWNQAELRVPVLADPW